MRVTVSHAQRKEEHLRACLEEDVTFHRPTSGFDLVQLPHCAAPELSLVEIDLSTSFLGRNLKAPLLISSMTGGAASARRINHHLAQAAQELGVALALGSLRAALEDDQVAATYQVRRVAPDVFLCANLGAVQLNYGYGVDECRRAVDLVEADALILHLNPLQEALQDGGNTNFAGLLDQIGAVCAHLETPVIVKEVGWGISEHVARRLHEAGVAAIDVAGAGGTSWSQVERHRAESDSARRIAEAFTDWGIPTTQALFEARRGAPDATLIASGGVRNGVHVAKSLALGAHLAGLALPLLEPAQRSADAVHMRMEELIGELRIAMFCTGCRRVDDLRRLPVTMRHPELYTPAGETASGR
jgi:isopentenyl-diphosphate Delta-isomerase